jgi:sugar diacid utilization regulator
MGEPAAGLGGFGQSHRQAVESWALTGAAGVGDVVRYGDVAVLIALLRDPALAEVVLQRELGPLAADDPHATELRAVLRTYLESGLNTVSTATALGYCRRTIERRLRHAETLIGHVSRQRSSELLMAIRIAEVRRQGKSPPGTAQSQSAAGRPTPHLHSIGSF